MGYVRILLVILGISFVILGWKIYDTSYLDHSPNWGIQVDAQPDGVIQLEEDLSSTPLEIEKLIAQVKALEAQQRSLYESLYTATVDLEKHSRLHPDLIAKIGPMANLNLKDFTKTSDTLVEAATYEANLPADSLIRFIVSDLRMALMRTNEKKLKYIEKMGLYHIESPIEVEVYVAPTPVQDSMYIDPNIEAAPPVFSRGWDISESDGDLLWRTHKIMTDIDFVQARMAKNVSEIIRKYEKLDRSATKVEETPRAFMFMQSKSKPYVEVDLSIWRCRLGLFWCSPIGTIKALYYQSLMVPHPSSGKPVEGFLVEVELTEPTDAKVLHIHEPHSH